MSIEDPFSKGCTPAECYVYKIVEIWVIYESVIAL